MAHPPHLLMEGLQNKQCNQQRTNKHQASMSRRQNIRRTAHNELQHNARAYVASVLDPFRHKGARVPDTALFPTSTQRFILRTEVPFVEIKDPVGDPLEPPKYLAAMVMTPDLRGHLATPSQAMLQNGYINITWLGQNHPNMDTAGLNFALYRTVSAGFRVINVAPQLKRQGALILNSQPPQLELPEGSNAPSSEWHSLAMMSQQTILLDAASLPKEGITMNWLPLTGASMKIGTNDDNIRTSAAQFRPPNRPSMDTLTGFALVVSDPEATSLMVETVINLETIPFPQTEILFETEVVVGGDEDVAAAYVEATRSLESANGHLWNDLVGVTTNPPSSPSPGVLMNSAAVGLLPMLLSALQTEGCQPQKRDQVLPGLGKAVKQIPVVGNLLGGLGSALGLFINPEWKEYFLKRHQIYEKLSMQVEPLLLTAQEEIHSKQQPPSVSKHGSWTKL